jgi:hypothetical protein
MFHKSIRRDVFLLGTWLQFFAPVFGVQIACKRGSFVSFDHVITGWHKLSGLFVWANVHQHGNGYQAGTDVGDGDGQQYTQHAHNIVL